MADEARAALGVRGDPDPDPDPDPHRSPRPLPLLVQHLTSDGGVCKTLLRAGSGQRVPPDASVAVRYAGYLGNWKSFFCSNMHDKDPKLMKLGKDITLLGLELGLLSMAKGEVAHFSFAPCYAYGQRGCPPRIPPDSTVFFEVEVLDFIDSAECDAFFELREEQQDMFPLEKVLKVAATEREFGNYYFHKQNFRVAKRRYKRALSILDRSSSSEAERNQINTSKLLLLLNLSLTYLKLEHPKQALKYGEMALKMDPGNAKALFRCGQACLLMRDYSKSRDFLVRAQCVQPFNRDINNALKNLARSCTEYMAMQEEMCCRMFGRLRSSD